MRGCRRVHGRKGSRTQHFRICSSLESGSQGCSSLTAMPALPACYNTQFALLSRWSPGGPEISMRGLTGSDLALQQASGRIRSDQAMNSRYNSQCRSPGHSCASTGAAMSHPQFEPT